MLNTNKSDSDVMVDNLREIYNNTYDMIKVLDEIFKKKISGRLTTNNLDSIIEITHAINDAGNLLLGIHHTILKKDKVISIGDSSSVKDKYDDYYYDM